MSAWARPGVKCVCVKKGSWSGMLSGRAGSGPGYREICTIKSVHTNGEGVTGLRIEGYFGVFVANRFRPVVPSKTQEQDVAIFRHHLSDEPVDA